MQSVAQGWLVYRLTGSSLLLGVVAFASQIPIFLLSPVGGTVADRYNRHRVVIATQTTSMVLAAILATLTLGHWIKVWELIVLASSLGVVNAFDIPARQSFLVEMVGREDLMNAIALNSSMFNGARVVGPAIAGILVASIGEGWCFFVNAASFIAVSIVAFMVLGSVLEGIPAIVLFGPLLFPIARAVGVHEVHYAMIIILAMGIGLFAPPFGVGYYAACAIGRVDPAEGIRPIWGYLLALLVGLIVVAIFPWISIGFL